MTLGLFAKALATPNAGSRLLGGKPDEGEPHVRFGRGALETEPVGYRASTLPHKAIGAQRESEGVIVPVIRADENAQVGKGPHFGHACEGGSVWA